MDYDVVIVGGSYSGLTMGIALAKLNFKLAIITPTKITKKIIDKENNRSFAISKTSICMLNLLGIWPKLNGNFYGINKVSILDGNPCDIFQNILLKFNQNINNSNNKYVAKVVKSGYLLNAMWDISQKEVNIKFFDKHYLKNFYIRYNKVNLILDDDTKISTSLVIAADGSNSLLRKKLDIATLNYDYKQVAIVCNVKHEKPHQGIAYKHFYPNGPFTSLPLPNNKLGEYNSNVIWIENLDFARKLMFNGDIFFNKEMAKRFGLHLGEVKICSDKISYNLNLQIAYEYIKNRVALICNAAHNIHPITGQGLNIGLRDIAVLSEVIFEARNLGLDFANDIILKKYQQWRRFDVFTHVFFANTINSLFSNNILPIRFIRDLGLKLVNNIFFIKNFFILEAAAQSGKLPSMLKGNLPKNNLF